MTAIASATDSMIEEDGHAFTYTPGGIVPLGSDTPPSIEHLTVATPSGLFRPERGRPWYHAPRDPGIQTDVTCDSRNADGSCKGHRPPLMEDFVRPGPERKGPWHIGRITGTGDRLNADESSRKWLIAYVSGGRAGGVIIESDWADVWARADAVCAQEIHTRKHTHYVRGPMATLENRVRYGGRKGRRAARRIRAHYDDVFAHAMRSVSAARNAAAAADRLQRAIDEATKKAKGSGGGNG